jgi:hypothetical protein
MKKTFIYGLKEINTDVIRYVGKSNNPNRRKLEHIRDANKNKNHKCYWINKVINSGSKIEVVILEEVYDYEWEEKEVFWIKKLKDNLTNSCDGGLGGRSGHISFLLTYSELKEILKKNYPFIKTSKDYINFFKGKNELHLIPKDPYQYFKKTQEWISWGDFLGTGNISVNIKSGKFLSYEETKSWVNENLPHIKTAYDWNEYIKNNELPEFITKKPQRLINSNEKFSFKKFLNADAKKKRDPKNIFLDYDQAKNYIKNEIKIKINSVSEWRDYRKNDVIIKTLIPSNASEYYKKSNTWVSWYDFLSLK